MLLDNGRTAALADHDRPAGAALHPLLGLPERLPGLRAGRRPRLRLALPGADRRDPLPAAARHVTPRSTRRCRTPRPCAAPATRCARSRSTSPRRWSTCAPRSSTPSGKDILPRTGGVPACPAWVLRSPRLLGRGQRAASAEPQAGRPVGPDPPAAAAADRLDRHPRRPRPAAGVVPRLVGHGPGMTAHRRRARPRPHPRRDRRGEPPRPLPLPPRPPRAPGKRR